MEGLSLARRRANVRAKTLDADMVARVAFGLLCLAVAIGIFVYPTYPNYDSYYSLLWGREVLDLQLPGFEGFRVPTEHPLAIAVGALLSLFGDAATGCGSRRRSRPTCGSSGASTGSGGSRSRR